MKLTFKNLFIVVFAFFLTACAQEGFSPSSIANKQVPIPNDLVPSAEYDLSSMLPEEQQNAKVMGLRDKVLMRSDISVKSLDNALKFYDKNINKIKNKKVISIFDITKHSGTKRLYVIETDTGNVTSMHVSHGKNSDRKNTGYATEFSNTSSSLQSSLGFVLTAETYYGKNGYSLRLDGLESRNSNVRRRAVVIHGADYVSPNLSKMGRSYGCPAVSRANNKWYIDKVKGGSLFYTFHANQP